MSLYEKNLAALKTKNPELAGRLEKLDKADTERFVVEESRKGDPTLKIRTDEGEYVYIHSKYDPRQDARRFLEGFETDNKEVLIVIGLGLGYHVLRLAEHLKSYSSILVIEKELEVFRLFMELHDCTELLEKKIIFSAGDDAVTAAGYTQFFSWQISTMKYEIIQYMPLTSLAVAETREYYKELFEESKRQLNAYMMNINTIMGHSYSSQQNIWNNMPEVIRHPGVNTLFGKFKGKPAIIAAAGPSLDKQIPLLKELKDNAVVLCVDTALKTLLAQDFKPHIATAIDFLQLNFDKVKGADTDGYYMAALPAVVEDFYNHFLDNLFVFYAPHMFYQWMEANIASRGPLPSGGSVSHAAFQLAVHMGCDPIVFVGLDLAYTGGFSHAKNSIYDGVSVEGDELEKMTAVESFDGGTVHTTKDMWSMIVAFEKMIEGVDVRVIDATEGGAKIEGMEIMPLADVRSTCLTEAIDVLGTVGACYNGDFECKPREASKAIQALLDDVTELIEVADEGSVNCKRAEKQLKKKGGYDKVKTDRYMKAIRESHERILEKENVSDLINAMLMRVNHEYSMRKRHTDENDEVKRKDVRKDMGDLRMFFDAIKNACEEYEAMMSGALTNVKRDVAAGS